MELYKINKKGLTAPCCWELANSSDGTVLVRYYDTGGHQYPKDMSLEFTPAAMDSEGHIPVNLISAAYNSIPLYSDHD